MSLLTIALAAAAPSVYAAATLVVGDASVTAGRNTTTMPFVVSRSGDIGFDVTVHYTTQDGTAVAGRDYIATSGSLTIPAGQGSATLSVPLLSQAARRPKSFTLLLSDASAQAPTGPVWAGAGNAVSGRYAEGSAVADFNSDGKPDLALPSFVDGSVTVLRNDTASNSPQANFAPAAVLSGLSGPGRLVATDLNGDGKPDLVVPNVDTNRIDVYLNATPIGATSFSFSHTSISNTGTAAIAVTSADIDGDGKPDIVICSVTPGQVIVLLNRTPVGAAAPSFASPASFSVGTVAAAYSYAITTLDFDGDGRPDVAISNLNTAEVAILRNTTVGGAAAASFAAPVAFRTADGATGLASADINGDGRPDLVSAENGLTTGTTWSVLLNRTPAGATVPQFAVSSQVGPAPYGVALKDIDGDGRADVVFASLLVQSNGDSGISVLLNRTAPGANSATFVPYASVLAGDEPHAVAVADFNGDGRLDFAMMDTVSTLAGFFFAVPPVANPQVTIVDGSAVGTIQPRPPRP